MDEIGDAVDLVTRVREVTEEFKRHTSAFIIMEHLGATINMISMFGLVILLGMLVDNGIIISENAYRHMEGRKENQLKSFPRRSHSGLKNW